MRVIAAAILALAGITSYGLGGIAVAISRGSDGYDAKYLGGILLALAALLYLKEYGWIFGGRDQGRLPEGPA